MPHTIKYPELSKKENQYVLYMSYPKDGEIVVGCTDFSIIGNPCPDFVLWNEKVYEFLHFELTEKWFCSSIRYKQTTKQPTGFVYKLY